MVKTKGYICAVVVLIVLMGIIIDVCTDIAIIKQIIRREDYIYYDPKIIPLLLIVPAMIFTELCVLCVILPFKEKTFSFMGRFKIAMIAYAWVALIVGIILSIVISFYPLGTDYYKCDSTSVISSGSHYAKTKELCKAKARKASDD